MIKNELLEIVQKLEIIITNSQELRELYEQTLCQYKKFLKEVPSCIKENNVSELDDVSFEAISSLAMFTKCCEKFIETAIWTDELYREY